MGGYLRHCGKCDVPFEDVTADGGGAGRFFGKGYPFVTVAVSEKLPDSH